MTLRSAGFVTEAITGPRSFGSAAPQWMGKRDTAVPGSGCEVSRIWVERLGVVIGVSAPETARAPRDDGSESPQVLQKACATKGAASIRTERTPGLPRTGPGHAEMRHHARPDVRERRSPAERAGQDIGAQEEDRSVLPRMVRSPPGRVVAVVGGDGAKITGMQCRANLRQAGVEGFERGGVARHVAAVAELAVEID